jgi:transcriptional regulator with XRE-family HTH domain
MRRLGEEILYWRLKRNLSQSQLGKRVGVERETVSAWEHGENIPEAPHWAALEEALGHRFFPGRKRLIQKLVAEAEALRRRRKAAPPMPGAEGPAT